MPGNNAASRVKALVDRVQSVSHKLTMMDGLREVFGVDGQEERGVARRIEALHLQLDLAESQLRSAAFPDVLFMRLFGKLRDAFRAALLQQQFSHVRTTVDEAACLCLDWCSFALPDEGENLDQSSVAALAKQLAELLSSPVLSELPHGIRDLFKLHLQAILDALQLVDIEGSKPLQKAAKSAAADLVIHADEIDAAVEVAPEKQAKFFQKFGDVFNKAMEGAATGGKGADGVEKMIKLVSERGPQAIEAFAGLVKLIGN